MSSPPPPEPSDSVLVPDLDTRMAKVVCRSVLESLFPGICLEYVKTLTTKFGYHSDLIIAHILDEQDQKRPYPTQTKGGQKRKRTEDEEDPAARFSTNEHRQRCENKLYRDFGLHVLASEFQSVSHRKIAAKFKENDNRVFETYLALEAQANSLSRKGRKVRLKEIDINDPTVQDEVQKQPIGRSEALEEFLAARKSLGRSQHVAAAEQRSLVDEEKNLQMAIEAGNTSDCECCYVEVATNRLVYCNAETPHFFCFDCARRMAEAQVGLSKYHLGCMSTDGCDAGFSHAQKQLFLDAKLTKALENIEQEEALRLAGIEGLEKCPFCNYAAEYPPVEVDKEFRCGDAECAIVSCRLCRKETHIPQTCHEAALADGVSARRQIEEAMSAALIRNCNKCQTPFIKEHGCNKMTCTRPGCRNVQCYVCHKSCAYDHFDDSTRGGKSGNCPLFDSVERRHEQEVLAAEEKARQQVAALNPDIDAALLKVTVSDRVKNDDEKRRQASDRGLPLGLVLPPAEAAAVQQAAQQLAEQPGQQPRLQARLQHARLLARQAQRLEAQQQAQQQGQQQAQQRALLEIQQLQQWQHIDLQQAIQQAHRHMHRALQSPALLQPPAPLQLPAQQEALLPRLPRLGRLQAQIQQFQQPVDHIAHAEQFRSHMLERVADLRRLGARIQGHGRIHHQAQPGLQADNAPPHNNAGMNAPQANQNNALADGVAQDLRRAGQRAHQLWLNPNLVQIPARGIQPGSRQLPKKTRVGESMANPIMLDGPPAPGPAQRASARLMQQRAVDGMSKPNIANSRR